MRRRRSRVSRRERAHFDEEGFLRLARPIADHAAIEAARTALEAAFASPDAVPAQKRRDLAGGRGARRTAGPAIAELLDPSQFVPALRHSAIVPAAAGLARDVLRARVRLEFDHAIAKPPHNGEATQWHQDAAYHEPMAVRWDRLVTVWVALQDVGEHQGCMEFVPGSHRDGFVPHRTHGHDAHGPLFEAALPHGATAVACPVPAGGATLHRPSTLHATGPNHGDTTRLVWVLRFSVDDERRAHSLVRRVLRRITARP